MALNGGREMLRLRPFRSPDAKEIITWTNELNEFYKWSAGILGDFPFSEEQFQHEGEKQIMSKVKVTI